MFLTFFFSALGIGKTILVPLTTSLYVPGTMADTENVIVDVGTGFYVEKVRHLGSFPGGPSERC